MNETKSTLRKTIAISESILRVVDGFADERHLSRSKAVSYLVARGLQSIRDLE